MSASFPDSPDELLRWLQMRRSEHLKNIPSDKLTEGTISLMKSLALAQKLSLQDWADRSGRPKSTISEVLNLVTKQVPCTTLLDLSHGLGFALEELLSCRRQMLACQPPEDP